MNRYIIRGGIEGKKRLEVLARTMWPVTSRALERAGLGCGMNCLDLGCGGGDVALELAQLVGPEGQVVGLDYDEVKITLARQSAEARGVHNVQFRQFDIQDWDEDSQHDFIYCRFLLTHLTDPSRALRQMLRALRSGGAALVEDIDFSGHVWHPQCEALERYVHLYRTAAARCGGDADIGPKLYLMLQEAGCSRLNLDVVQPTFVAGEGKKIAILTLINIADTVLAEGLATEAELQKTIDELARFTENPSTMISMPRVFQVWGRRG